MSTVGDQNYPASGFNRTRAQVQQAIADLLGGANKSDIQAVADRCWEDAIRDFNTCPWSFARVTDDIVIDSTMKTNTTPPTVASTGAGVGFVLETGRKIQYWVEERIKSGNRILQRNDTAGPTQTPQLVTLTGTGAVVKPVVSRPAILNPDATHWALYGTPTSGSHQSATAAYPYGFLIGEAPIAQAGIEDTRQGINPGIVPNSDIYQGNEYDLTAPFRNPVRAILVDENGATRYALTWIPWRRWTTYRPWQITTGSSPIWWTARNWYKTGRIQLDPRPASQTTYPIVRIAYNTPILVPTGPDPEARLDVPVEIDQAIFRRASIIARRRHIGPASVSDTEIEEDRQAYYELEVQWRDHPDF